MRSTVFTLFVLLANCTTVQSPLGRLRADPPGQGGCWAWPGRHADGRVSFSAAGGAGAAWVNIRGRDTLMRLAEGQDQTGLETTGHAVYVASGLTLRAAFEVDVPAPPEEECGHYTVKGTLTLEESDGTKHVLHVNGACGA